MRIKAQQAGILRTSLVHLVDRQLHVSCQCICRGRHFCHELPEALDLLQKVGIGSGSGRRHSLQKQTE